MPLRLARATIGDLWRFLSAQKSQRLEHEYQLLVTETLCGRVWVALDGSSPLALGGVLVTSAEQPGTAWLCVLPEARARIAPLALMMRTVLRVEAGRHPAGVVCVVREDNPEGRRLALALGCTETDRRKLRLVEWRWHGGRSRDGDGQRGQEAGAARRAGAGAAGG